jgi:hypothetical protein
MVSTLEIPYSSFISCTAYPPCYGVKDTNYEAPNTLFLNILSLCSICRVRYHLSYSRKTTGKIMVVCILVFGLLDRTRKDKMF